MKMQKLFIVAGLAVLAVTARWAHAAQTTSSISGSPEHLPASPGQLIVIPSEEWYNKGDAAFAAGDYTYAVECFKQAIALQPNYADYHLYLGIVYGVKGMAEESIKEFKTALEINPNHTEAFVNLGITYYKRGMHEEAITAYKNALALNPAHSSAHSNLGSVYYRKGMLAEAIAAYIKALAIDPSSLDTHYNLGFTYYKQGMLDESIETYKKLLQLKPTYAMAHNALGTVYRDKGQPSLAADHFYQAGVLFLKQDNRERALDSYEHLKQTQSKSELEQALYKELYPTPEAP